jgi:hypothetical protein
MIVVVDVARLTVERLLGSKTVLFSAQGAITSGEY